MFIRPGLFFACSISSARFLYGASPRTTSTLGVREAMPSGTRSRAASYEADCGSSTARKVSGAFGANSIVRPSFLALTTLVVPSAPPAPGRLTTTTGVLSSFAISSPMARPETSAASPGASGTTTLMGPDGNGWACAETAAQASTMATTNLLRLRIDHDVRKGFRIGWQFAVARRHAADGEHVGDGVHGLLVGERVRS